jgi:hypothetical protein
LVVEVSTLATGREIVIGSGAGVGVGVGVGDGLGVGLGVGVGVGAATQVGNLKLPIRVLELIWEPLLKYSWVYQKVQSSTGSTVMAL